tara:strand:+ start:470 stop:997 length:528 start_codon:yes stop_codon:yes gene_type:complete
MQKKVFGDVTIPKNKIYKDNLKKEIKNIKEDIIKDCLKTKSKTVLSFNFQVFTKHHNKLYSLFIDSCKKKLKKFSVVNNPTKLWSYFTDKNFHEGDIWHNHIGTCTICGVLYLETAKDCGIEFEDNNKIIYIEPKNYDLLIFPGSLNHRPIISNNKKRISINFEVFCHESINQIF